MTDLERMEEVARKAADKFLASYDTRLLDRFEETFDPPTILSLISELREAREALKAAKALLDNINEFGTITDGEFLDCADNMVRAALSNGTGNTRGNKDE